VTAICAAIDRLLWLRANRLPLVGRLHTPTFAMLLLTSLAACAANRGAQGPSTNTSLITLQEIEDSHQPNLFDVVRAVRPMWLRQFSTAVQNSQNTGVSVYVDNQRVGGLEVLRDMTTTTATSLRYYTASEAQSRFGLGNLQGVIQVNTARGGT
jgi:hypothetical protein